MKCLVHVSSPPTFSLSKGPQIRLSLSPSLFVSVSATPLPTLGVSGSHSPFSPFLPFSHCHVYMHTHALPWKHTDYTAGTSTFKSPFDIFDSSYISR